MQHDLDQLRKLENHAKETIFEHMSMTRHWFPNIKCAQNPDSIGPDGLEREHPLDLLNLLPSEYSQVSKFFSSP